MAQEFTFDVTLTGTARVKAETQEQAEKIFREFMRDCELRATTDNIEFTMGDIEGALDLMEIDGEAV